MRSLVSTILLACVLLTGSLAKAQGTDPVTPNGPGVVQLGSTSQWWKNLFMGANATSYATITGTFTVPRTITIPDATGTMALAAGGGAFSATTLAATATASLTLGTSGSAVGQAIFNNATSGTITVAPPTGALNTVAVTLPDNTGSLATGTTCGASLAAGGTCANTVLGGNGHFVVGTFVLGTNASAVIGVSPAFTSSTSWNCVANDITTRANPVQAIPQSGTAFTITNTTGASDLISVICAGN